MKPIYVTVTNEEFYAVLREDAEAGETNWTVSRHVRRGDRIALYVCSPVCAVVAAGEASTDAELCDDPSNEWYGHHFIDIHGLRMLREPVTRKALLAEFPGWGFWKQPRVGVRVPDCYLPGMGRLLG